MREIKNGETVERPMDGTSVLKQITKRKANRGKTFARSARRYAALMFASAVFAAAAFVACERVPAVPPITPPPPPPQGIKWIELPEIPDNLPSTQVVVTHSFVSEGKWMRNFTMLYDKNDKLAHWVAYPLHSAYFGSSGRGDNFAYDPQIPTNFQMPITTGGYGKSGIDRGHQIASADRTITVEANDQTFFVSNMTPQNSTLNQEQWADFEIDLRSMVAKNAGRKDTLYVVTGCVTSGETITTRGVTGAKPDAYYKVMLRTKSNTADFPKGDDAMCIGVWYQNAAPSGGSWKTRLKTVAEIEQLTGHKFFPAVSQAVKESYNKSDWGIYQ